MTTLPTYPRILYGEASFSRIRLNRWLYVDKTRFLLGAGAAAEVTVARDGAAPAALADPAVTGTVSSSSLPIRRHGVVGYPCATVAS